MVLFGESVVFVCWTTSLQDETPVCHDCLVVNGTSKFIINISSRHGCWVVNVGSPAGNCKKSVNVWSLARAPQHDIKFGVRRLASLYRYSRKWKPWSEQWRTRTA